MTWTPATTETGAQRTPAPRAVQPVQSARIPTPPALVALYILAAVPGLIGATLAVIGMLNANYPFLLGWGGYLILTTFGVYFFLVLPLVAIVQAIHQTIRFRRPNGE